MEPHQEQPARGRPKTKIKKAAPKTKIPKKKKCEGGTCSMFLADLTRKLQLKRMKEQEAEIPRNIIDSIINAISSALPVTVSKKTIERMESPPRIEVLQSMAPELMPQDFVELPLPAQTEVIVLEDENDTDRTGFKIPRMPVVDSGMLRPKIRPTIKISMHDVAINTGVDHDVASEIQKHVGTLRKISLIAEEFNQKTAKNLKEIVDSVQEDLIKKLEQIQAEQKYKEQLMEAQGQMKMEEEVEA